MTTEELLADFMKRSYQHAKINAIGIGTVKNVSDTRCDIENEFTPKLFDVRLNSVLGELDSYVTIVPKEGSIALYGILEGLEHEAVIIRTSAVEKLIIKTGNTIQEISAAGMKVAGGGESLKTVLNDLIAEIEKIVVVIGTTPNLPALEEIKLRLNKILI